MIRVKIYSIQKILRINIKLKRAFQYWKLPTINIVFMIPESVKLTDDKRTIQINYDNGSTLILTSSILRAKSPSAENKNNKQNSDISKFENVLIVNLDQVGNYALKITFSDGHDTGIYSWEYLFEIGSKS